MSIFLATAKHNGEDVKLISPIGDSALVTTYGAVEERLVRFSDLTDLVISDDVLENFRDIACNFGDDETESMVCVLTRSYTWAKILREHATR